MFLTRVSCQSLREKYPNTEFFLVRIFPRSDGIQRDTLSGKIFIGEKFCHFWKISYFSLTNFSYSSLFPDQFLKLKGLSWVGLLFFQRKVVVLVWDFSNWAWRSALLVSLIHGIGCCKYTPSWISQNKKFLYKLIFRDYKIFRRIPEEF